jgi:Holliday junction resolvasome RuvABC endonuclease subunit
MILGVDTSTSCGWALLLTDGRRVQSGVWNLKPLDDEGAGARFTRLHDRLDALRRTFPRITHVAYEIPGHLRTQAAVLSCFGITTHVESWCERNQLEYFGFAPSEVKNAAGLGGRVEKPEMIAAADRIWAPYSFATDDEADAMFLARALLVHLGELPPIPIPPKPPRPPRPRNPRRSTKREDADAESQLRLLRNLKHG